MESVSPPSTGRQLTRNALWNLLGAGCQGVVLLFLVAYMLRRLGPELYGVWALLAAVVSYFGLADVGGSPTLTRHIAEYHAKNDDASLAKLTNNSALFNIVVILLTGALGFALTDPLLQVLNIPLYLRGDARFVYQFVLLAFFTEIFANVFSSIVNGLQRMDVYNRISIASNLLRVVGTVIALEGRYGLHGVAVNELVMESFSLIVLAIAAKRLYPALQINPFKFDGPMLRHIVGFGAKLQIGGLSDLVNFQYDKLLLAHFLGVEWVAYYDIGTRLVKYARGLVLSVSVTMVPAVAKLFAIKDHAKITELYHTSSKYVMAIGSLGLGIFIFAARDITGLWVGPDLPGVETVALTMRIVAIGYFVNALTGITCHMSIGLGKPNYIVKVSVLQVLLNIGLSTLLVWKYGYFGAVVGSTGALTIGGLYFIGSFGKEVGDSLTQFTSKVLIRPLLASLLAGIPLILFAIPLFFWRRPAHSIQFLPLVAVDIVLFSGVYYLLMASMHYFNRDEIQSLQRHLPPRLKRFVPGSA